MPYRVLINCRFQTCFSCSDFSFRFIAESIICFQSSGPFSGDFRAVSSTALSGVDRVDESLILPDPEHKIYESKFHHGWDVHEKYIKLICIVT